MTSSSVAVIINPISGARGVPEVARARAEQAAALLDARGLDAHVVLTERAGHASDLTRAFAARGVSCVIAWGGDGTVNEVGSALAFTDTPLGIVPSGSGNGLARELGIPLDASRALAVAIDGAPRTIDAGECEGRLFFNVAGIGLDARVAHRFARAGAGRRGLPGYIRATVQELRAFRAEACSVTVGGETIQARPLLMAIANSRQYGNGAVIAPQAEVDDGRLDVVIIEDRSPWLAIWQVPRVFLGQVGQVRGVTMRRGETVEVCASSPILFHLDGEPFTGGAHLSARVRPGALQVRVPRI